jgi:DNA-binding MarR family transcriptional regulator
MKHDHDIRKLIRSIVSSGNELLREAGRLFKPYGISAAQFNVLHLLAEAKVGMQQSDITRALVVDPSSTTYLIDRMEALGWIKRLADRTDRRVWLISMTPSGKKLHGSVAPLYEAALRETLRGLDQSRINPITEALVEIQRAASAAVESVLNQNTASSKDTARA